MIVTKNIAGETQVWERMCLFEPFKALSCAVGVHLWCLTDKNMTNIMQKLADEGLEPFESAQEHYSAARNFVLTLVETTLPKIFRIFIQRSSPL